MKRKALKELIQRIYWQGFYDGADMHKVPRDQFMGNNEAREKWRQDNYSKYLEQLKDLVS